MHRRVGAYVLLAVLASPSALLAAELPAIKASRSNAVPGCVTPGRLLAFLESRNPNLDPRFHAVATEYMRLGETLSVRWDYAFYQMLLETGSLTFHDGSRAGDVRPMQNNFAGLGATGHGQHGESFKDVATGVRAHLEHLLLYAGERIDKPVAERTRNVQEWGVLTDWQRGFSRPITFADMASKWAPGTRSYRRMIEGIAERFQEFCSRQDPRPELVKEARAPKDDGKERASGAELAERAIVAGKAQNDERRSALGAEPVATPARSLSAPASPEVAPGAPAPLAVDDGAGRLERGDPKAMSPSTVSGAKPAGVAKPEKAAANSNPDKTFQTASMAGGGAKPLANGAAPPAQKCRVWTASYGGQKAMIIKSLVDKVVNYTVLDVNEGSEAREAEAFIAAYAKNGAIAGQFASQAQALDKAFELCPEG